MGNTDLSETSSVNIAEHKIVKVKVIKDYLIEVFFAEGIVKQVDASILFSLHQAFSPLVDDYDLFCSVKAAGFCLKWSDEIDVSSWWVWDNGTTVKSIFDDLISMRDATHDWGLSESTLRKALQRGKLVKGIDAKKFDNQWVLIKASLVREYGPSLKDRLDNKVRELEQLRNNDDPISEYYESHPEKAEALQEIKKRLIDEIEEIKSLIG